MKSLVLLSALSLSLPFTASSGTFYVDAASQTPLSPYSTWSTAATNIQDAITASTLVGAAGDEIVVTNGVYATGGYRLGGVFNRIVPRMWSTVRSVNGPRHTVIEGHPLTTLAGTEGVRCAYLRSGVVLSGFTLRNGGAATGQGAGVYCEANDALVTNCVLTGNVCRYEGGAAYNGILKNSVLTGNAAGTLFLPSPTGGGAFGSILVNCTVTANQGGGVYNARLTNCLVYYNTAGLESGNYNSGSTLSYCDTYPLPATGEGNISLDPLLASATHISLGSPCRGAGLASAALGTDIDGQPWANPPSIGCDEPYPAAADSFLSVAIGAPWTNLDVGFEAEFTANIEGETSSSVWDFGDGTTVSNRVFASHAWTAPGDYVLTLRAFNGSPAGVSASVPIHVEAAPTLYVSPQTTNPVPPYTSWATAAPEIQSAVDAAVTTRTLVLVNDGVYGSGGRTYGAITNRLLVEKPIEIRSLNGPRNCTIVGDAIPSTPAGYATGTMRCVYLADRAVLSGFTLTNGVASPSGQVPAADRSGGGVFCASVRSMVTNCLLTGNFARGSGGGVCLGTLLNCEVSRNYASSGGGATLAFLIGCRIATNTAAYEMGGGADASFLTNCTLALNKASLTGAGVSRCTVYNSIVYGNGWPPGSTNYYNSSLYYCCTDPLPTTGIGNFTNDPRFVNLLRGDLHLQPDSPCINAGLNAYVSTSTDLDGNSRIAGGTVDLGAYEVQSPDSLISYAWLQSYGLPTDGSADAIDSDRDGLRNWQEWLAGTDPTNAASALRLTTVSADLPSVTITWQSTSNRNYFVERANLSGAAPAFSCIASNIAGSASTTSFTDPNAPASEPVFYRVGVYSP